jgi:hypothetical protein
MVNAIPLAELRPYMGELKVESALFVVQEPSGWMDNKTVPAWGVCAWIVNVTATVPSGNKYHYAYIVEPFEGRVFLIWMVLHPTSPAFPSFPPT